MRLVIIALMLALAAPAVAQNPPPDPLGAVHDLVEPLYTFDMQASKGEALVPVLGNDQIQATFFDLSSDPPQPGPVLPGNGHIVQLTVDKTNVPAGWTVGNAIPDYFITVPGSQQDFSITVSAEPSAKVSVFHFNVTAHVTTQTGVTADLSIEVAARSPGLETFLVQGTQTIDGTVSPREFYTATIHIQNTGLYPRTYEMEVVDNPCGMTVITPGTMTVRAGKTDDFSVGFRATDRDLFYIIGTLCSVSFQVKPTDNQFIQRQVIISATVQGTSLDVSNYLWFLFIAILVLLIILFVRRRKERLEEEILGKPQKPWTIPVERVYLKHLKSHDERAWYLVRHHLMEDEYQSSLLWYHAYKAATKGARTKERLILKQEKAYEKWKAAQLKDIEVPLQKAARFEAKLQRKLDRKTRSAHKADSRKHAKVVEKMQASHEAKAARLTEKWEKAAAKAQKKGQPAPARPDTSPPDYPPAPTLEGVKLAEHGWSRKAARFRRRMERKQGNLEVRFEKRDARYLAKVRRKVRRIARKLHDPDFVAAHPLLQ